ncbi:radical SAM family heme chaperone HemW [bacterium]|nr:radical SAM family heme chaperone HemW [bacterium]
MAGIYIHIPLCKKKCDYCDFYSEEKKVHLILPFINALIREADLYTSHFPPKGEKISTIYLGGGTPSLLHSDLLETILHHLLSLYPSVSEPEITIEVNPGTISSDTLTRYRNIGISRLSIGVQSFDDRELQLLGRIHTAKQAEQIIETAHQIGFKNVGIDLIYGLPGQSLKSWQSNLEKAVSLSPTHISTYELTWSHSTPLGAKIKSGLLPYPDKEKIADMYIWTSEFLNSGGYEHYEISNFAQSGYRCQHNEGYWTGRPYLGLGPSAHSYIGDRRFWNVSNIRNYIDVLSQNRFPVAGEEKISREQVILEKVMLGFRRQEGIPLKLLKKKRSQIDHLIQAGLMNRRKDMVSLTTKGFLLADEVALQMTCSSE